MILLNRSNRFESNVCLHQELNECAAYVPEAGSRVTEGRNPRGINDELYSLMTVMRLHQI